MRSTGHSHPVSIIGPVITGNAFFPIWYHIHAFAGPRELGWSDTLYSFLESDGAVQCNAPTCTICLALALALSGPGPEGPGQGQSGSGPGPIEIFIDNSIILYKYKLYKKRPYKRRLLPLPPYFHHHFDTSPPSQCGPPTPKS